MTTHSSSLAVPSNCGERVSTRIGFLIGGLVMSAWAPLVPLAKEGAALDEGELGLLLLGLGIGSILAMPFGGYITARFGCRLVIISSVLALCVALPFLVCLTSLSLLGVAILFFGASMGMLDCAINIQSILVEKKSGESLQSGFHGLYSVGGILGSGAMTVLLSLGIDPLLCVLCIIGFVLSALYKAAPGLLPYGTGREGPMFALPRGIVALLGALCFISFLTEGAILDWGAVFLVSNRGMEASMAGLGYTCFAVMMTLGRLFGDSIVKKYGGVIVVTLGGVLASSGMILCLLFEGWPASLVGYSLIGAGCSNIAPVLFTAVGRQQRMPHQVAVPAVITMGYAGILIGPALIGMIAHVSTLSLALGCLIFLLLFVSASARFLR